MNKKVSGILLYVSLSLLFLWYGNAQEKMTLSIEQSIDIGLKASKSLHASQMRVQAADARASEVGASRLPSLKLSGSYTRLSDVPPFVQTIPAGTFGPQQPELSFTLSPVVLNNYNLRLSLQQPLFTGFRVESSSNIADLSARATQEELHRDEAELIYDIRNAYWTLYKAFEFKKVIDENVEQVNAHLDDVQHLMNQGMATTNDVLRVQVQLSNAQLLQIDAKNNVRLAMLALNNTIGQPLETSIELVSIPDSSFRESSKGSDKDLNALVLKAMENRAELKSMQYRVEASEAGVTQAKSGWYPQVYLTGNYYYARPNQRILPTEDRFNDTWDIGISASLDIWNWGTTVHQTQQAQAQLTQTQDALSQLRDGITLEVTQNYLNVDQAKERIGVSDQSVKQAEENYRVTNEKFKLGVALNSDLLDAEAALLQAKWNHIQALVDFELAQARLTKSVGS
jgi:outer membrane protein